MREGIRQSQATAIDGGNGYASVDQRGKHLAGPHQLVHIHARERGVDF